MTVDALWRERPRDRFLRGSAAAFLGLLVGAWIVGDFALTDLTTERAGRNLTRFAAEITPMPLRGDGFDAGALVAWLTRVVPFDAVANTVALAVAATGLAVAAGTVMSLGAAHTFASPEPWLPSARSPSAAARLGWAGVVRATRLALLFLRAVPEYVWAFLLVAFLGTGAWPAVLALALHNAGILGKLFAEGIEDLEPEPARAVRGLGASRLQVMSVAVFPAILNRWLLYAFVRWETAVREATVVGLLGVVSLGWYIRDSRARTHYDEMIALIAVGALLIGLGDALSVWVRSRLR